jgi:hydroxymethylglutaryl-CoA synthase
MSVGVERLHVYVPAHRLPLADLAAARSTQRDPHGVIEVAVAAPNEDAVTLAATAGARLLHGDGVDADAIGLLVLATSHPVCAAPVVHRLLGLDAQCRVVDVRHPGCAGATAISTAADWVRAGGMRQRRALVVAADVVRRPLGAADESAQGAGAAAILVSSEPRALLFADDGIAWTAASDDEALARAFLSLRKRERPEPEGSEVVTDRLARVAYGAPSPAAARAAHRRLVERDWHENERRWPQVEPVLDTALHGAIVEQVDPGLALLSHVGDAGSATLGLALATLIEAEGRLLSGRRIGCVGVGGGAAELWTALVSGRVATDAGVAASRRVPLTVAEYEAMARGDGVPAGFAGDFIRTGDGSYRRPS